MTENTQEFVPRRLEYWEADGDWGWTLIDIRNGEVVGRSHETYREKRDARHNVVTTLLDGEQLDIESTVRT